MITNDPTGAALTGRTAVPTAAPAPLAALGGEPAGVLGQIDDAAIDRIAAHLLAAVPGMQIPALPIPDAAISAPPTPGALSPEVIAAAATSAGAPNPGIPVAGLAIPTPGIPQASLPESVVAGSTLPGIPGRAIPGVAVPGSAAPATATPSAMIPGAVAGGTIPSVGVLGVSLPSLDAGLPRLFDGQPSLPTTPPVSTPGYYFLTPAPATSRAPTTPLLSRRIFDVRDIRRDFPILQERIHGKPLVWLDNAATTQKPRAVIERLVHYYEHEYSNVHRAAHTLAARSTDAYEGARQKVQRFLGAGSPNEIVFVRGTTEAVNLVANSWGRQHIGEGDEIILTTLEHHSNIVPWQFLADAVGAVLRIVPVTDRGEVLLGDYGKLLNTRTRLVAITHVSNALGTILPVGEMIQAAHRHGARVLVDGAQAVSHFPVNVQALDADFYVLSGHKLFAPTGVGVLYGKQALLDEMPPWQGGGNMIQRVTFEKSTFADPPARFEAGTGTLGPAVGLGAAVDYLEQIGMENIARHERELLADGTDCLARIPGLTLIGTAPEKAGVLSFIVDGMTAEEMGSFLDQEGIAVRAGHHCAQPTMDRFGLTSTVRPSLALYNTHGEIDALVRAIRKALRR